MDFFDFLATADLKGLTHPNQVEAAYRKALKEQRFDKAKDTLYIKMGRCCYTCRYRISRKGNFIICRHMNDGKPIWEKAHCSKWQPTTNYKRLAQMERYLTLKGMAKNDEARRYFYRKNTNTRVKDAEVLNLGRCCFTCSHRIGRNGSFVHCSSLEKEVWEKAACRRFKMTDDRKRLDQFKRYFKGTGVNTTGTKWTMVQKTWERREEDDSEFWRDTWEEGYDGWEEIL